MTDIIRIATRQSPLALWQANFVGEKIKQHCPSIEIQLVPMITSGDKFLKDKLLAEGGKGLFVKELEEALLDNRADIAVHSMKDVPAAFPEGLSLTTICERHNPFDAFIAFSKQYKTINDLPKASIIGTASLRRQSQLLALRSDLEIKLLRGNIHTRLTKLQNGEYDAIILAVAGLERMAMQDNISSILNEEMMMPACGQGALGIECRTNDINVQTLLDPLNDPMTSLCVKAERHLNAQLGGNCHTPIAIYCTTEPNEQIHIRARILTADGKTIISDHQRGHQTDSVNLANRCAENLLAKGANRLLGLSQ